MFRKGHLMREWRNRQTRTFEGRVFTTYGFKSRLSHQEGDSSGIPFIHKLNMRVWRNWQTR